MREKENEPIKDSMTKRAEGGPPWKEGKRQV